jgi:hypothetical protein
MTLLYGRAGRVTAENGFPARADYPISAAVFIQDEGTARLGETQRQLTVLTDRGHGAASLERGEISRGGKVIDAPPLVILHIKHT